MSHSIVIFGASGDLTSRKLIPALYSLFCKDRLPEDTIVVGVARSEFTHDEWRDELREKAKKFLRESYRDETWNDFAKRIFYCPGDLTEREDMLRLADFLKKTEPDGDCTRLYYLATMPQLYEPAIAQLGACGRVDRLAARSRIVSV
jgi:glucose-6-phosphate 1-dehydrogenase